MISTELILGINEANLTEIRAIRNTVFCEEQQIDPAIEQDAYDSSAIHILASFAGKPAATGRLLITADEFIIGRVAVLPEFRGKRLGDLVVRLLIRTAFDMGAEQQVVHAQLPVRGFYEKLGFIARGDIYEEAGIPHITMVHEGDITGTCKEGDKR